MKLPRLISGVRRRLLLYLMLNGLAQAGAVVSLALLLRNAFDTLVIESRAGSSIAGLWQYFAAFSMIVALSAWLRWRERVDAERLGQDYVFELRQLLFAHMSRLSPRALQKRSHGGTMLRMVGDLTALRQWVSLGLARLAVAAIASTVTLLALALVNLNMAILVSLLLLSSVLVVFSLGKSLEQAARNARKQRSRLAAYITERLAAMPVVQALGQRERERRRLKKQSNALREAMLHRANRIGQMRAVTEAMVGLAGSWIILLGAWEIMQGQATAGAVVAAMMVVGMLSAPLRDLGRVHEYWRGARVSQEKIMQFLNARGRVWQPRSAPDLRVNGGKIEFRNVSCGESIVGFSRVIRAGERVALVGPNGSGKSTLLALINRLFDPDEGNILIDGQDISKCNISSLRASVGVVGPDFPLLRGSVEYNLKYRYPRASKAEINEVREFCGIDEMAASLPNGLRTRLVEGGMNLSVGQRARVALGRAMLGAPPILLLDEADANLDAQARGLIERIIDTYPGTVLIVTHRQDHISKMDQVIRLPVEQSCNNPVDSVSARLELSAVS